MKQTRILDAEELKLSITIVKMCLDICNPQHIVLHFLIFLIHKILHDYHFRNKYLFLPQTLNLKF